MPEQAKAGTVVMAGLPKTGKSTFLGAFYHVAESGDERPITLEVMPSARQHLEGIRGRWLRLEREARTSSTDPINNDLSLRVGGHGNILKVRWPDLSGEYFDEMVRKRRLNAEVAEILSSATAVMLFIHPDTITRAPRIQEVNKVASAVAPKSDIAADVTSGQLQDWDPMMVPGEVLVVELLQLLLSQQVGCAVEKISVVVSAWDLVRANFNSPSEYVAAELPLLDQFLEGNSSYQFRIFGVSALGGDPESERDRLQAEIDPIRRIQVIKSDGTDAEEGIFAPIRWLIQ